MLYGAGYWGEIIFDELRESDVTVIGVIDRSRKKLNGIHTYTIEEPLPEFDAVLVALLEPDEVIDLCRQYINVPMYTMKELFWEEKKEWNI